MINYLSMCFIICTSGLLGCAKMNSTLDASTALGNTATGGVDSGGGADNGNALPPLPTGDLTQENIGSKVRISNLFDDWTLKSAVSLGRGTHFADVTIECRGKIDLALALTPEQWQDKNLKAQYYTTMNQKIQDVGARLLNDKNNPFPEAEKQIFLNALKALAWQESNWQHYIRYKNWFFVFLSGGSYNALNDWGITQVARSGFNASNLLNEEFFNSKSYCSSLSSLYYGFNEYYNHYIRARSLSCNQTGDMMDIVLGAYNNYSSGFSACHDGLSTDPAYRTYQINAMNGLKTNYLNKPWVSQMTPR